MGRSYEKSNSSGSLHRTNEVITHKQFRVTRCVSDNQKVSKVTSKQTSFGQDRQHNCGSIYKQTGWNTLSSAMSASLGSMDVCIRTQHSSESSSHCGSQKYISRSVESDKDPSNRWELNNVVVQKIFQIWGHPTIDIFATFENKKAVVFCSWIQHPQALTVDALAINWDNMFAYAYPPLTLIPKVLPRMQKFQCEIILIAPFWPKQHWYPQLLQLLVAYPLRIPTIENLLTQGKRKVAHPDPDIFKLTACRLSTNVLKQEVFQKMLRNCCQLPGNQVLRRTINVSSENSIAGVLNGKLIPIQPL